LPRTWREGPEKSATARDRGRARALRNRLTDPERKLWWHLRHRMPLEGTHFRRQVPIGPYVADFRCLKACLVIEVDGDQHGYDENLLKDERRSKFLIAQGFSVVRFSNLDVMTTTNSVLEAIYAQLNISTPTPNPSPQGGRDQAGA
jgi:very-short-patch-repair endonuclease